MVAGFHAGRRAAPRLPCLPTSPALRSEIPEVGQPLLDRGVFFLGVRHGDRLAFGRRWPGRGETVGRGTRGDGRGSRISVRTRPSMSSGTGTPSRWRTVGAMSSRVAPSGVAPGRNGRAGGDQDAVHPVVAGRAEGGRDQLVGREVVQADRPVPPVAEDDGQVGGEVGVRARGTARRARRPARPAARRSRGGGSPAGRP